jgi:hypothetical protein
MDVFFPPWRWRSGQMESHFLVEDYGTLSVSPSLWEYSTTSVDHLHLCGGLRSFSINWKVKNDDLFEKVTKSENDTHSGSVVRTFNLSTPFMWSLMCFHIVNDITLLGCLVVWLIVNKNHLFCANIQQNVNSCACNDMRIVLDLFVCMCLNMHYPRNVDAEQGQSTRLFLFVFCGKSITK